MADSTFLYVTYIRTTPQELWRALTTPQFISQYWLGATAEADWKKGGAWKLVFADGRVADQGEIVDFEPERLLAIKWRNEWSEAFKAEGWSMCTMEHENAKFIGAVGGGWPRILSNLKSLLETGQTILTPKS